MPVDGVSSTHVAPIRSHTIWGYPQRLAIWVPPWGKVDNAVDQHYIDDLTGDYLDPNLTVEKAGALHVPWLANFCGTRL